jgi:hypothetical protein
MKLQENIERIKSMMGLIGEGTDRLTNKLIDKFSKKFYFHPSQNPNVESINQGDYYAMEYRKNKNTIEVYDRYFYDVFSEAGLPQNVYEKIRKDLIIGIIKNSEMEPNDDTVICVKTQSYTMKCAETFYYGGGGDFNDDMEKNVEIVFTSFDEGRFYVNYLVKFKFGFIEIDGYLHPYNTGRGVNYEFRPGIDSDDDEAQEYYDENHEDIEQEIFDEFYKTKPSQK